MGPASKEASSQCYNANISISEKSKNDEIHLNLNGHDVILLNIDENLVAVGSPPKKIVESVTGSTTESSVVKGMTSPLTAAFARLPIVSTTPRSFGLITTIAPSLFKSKCNGAHQSVLNNLTYQVVPGMNTLIPVSHSSDKFLNNNENENLVSNSLNMGYLVNKILNKTNSASSNYSHDIMNLNGLDDLHIQEVGESDCSLLSKFHDVTDTGMNDIGVLTNVDMVRDTSRRQQEFEKRLDLISRRLRRLQGRSALFHMQHQLGAFVKHQHANLQTMAKSIRAPPPTTLDLKTDLLQKENVKNLSTAALVDLVRRLQSSQQALTLRQRLTGTVESSESSNVLKLNEDLCIEMDRVSSTFQMNLKHVESGIDSDATETSSGGESCEEELDEDDDRCTKFSLKQRAESEWCKSRSAIGSRWAWLQAQVSDLEYRIRQHTDIYRQIRAAKGPVILNDSSHLLDPNSNKQANKSVRKLTPLEEKIANIERKNSEMTNGNISSLLYLDKQTKSVLSSVQNSSSSSSSSLNGKHVSAKTSHSLNGITLDPLSISSSTNELSNSDVSTNFILNSNEIDESCQASRCKPVKSYGKRKLLQTVGLHFTNKKASRLSTVNCNCYPPVTPCVMCCGRVNNVHQMDPFTMSRNERIALLDSAYHPVLSFNEDIALPLLFESSLKSSESQKSQNRSVRPIFERRRRYANEFVKKKFNRKSNKITSAVMLSSAKIRNKYEQKQITRNIGNNAFVRGKNDVMKKHNLKKKHKISLKQGQLSSNFNDYFSRDSPTNLKESMRKRRLESAYDIDNIVLPYGMATSVRVEKIQYKEIITPKWRIVPAFEKSDDSSVQVNEEEEEIEDTSDECYAMRHLRCEIAERKKFACQLKNNRRSRSQRSDSTNTVVEVLNVDNEANSDVSNSMIESFSMFRDDTTLNEIDNFDNFIQLRCRSRSSSESRSVDYDEIFTNKFHVEPWEKRQFPISDDELTELDDGKPFSKRKTNTIIDTTVVSKDKLLQSSNVDKFLQSSNVNPTVPNSDSSSDLEEVDMNDPDWALPHEERTKNVTLSNISFKLNNR